MTTFKVNWDTSRFGVEVGDFKADIDVAAAREALAVVAGGANAMKLCTFLAGASVATAATFVAGWSIMRTWPWMKPSLENDKTLQLSCPSDKAEEFEELTKAGGDLLSLTEPAALLKKDFEDISVDDDTKNKIDKLTQQLKDIKLMSVERLKSTEGDVKERVVIGDDITDAKVNITNQGGTKSVLSDGTGIAIGRRIGKGSVVTEVNKGVDSIVYAGTGCQNYARNKKSAYQIKVITRFKDGSERLEEMFSSTDRVQDIVDAISRLKEKKITKICYYESKKVIDNDTKVSALEESQPELVELIALED